MKQVIMVPTSIVLVLLAALPACFCQCRDYKNGYFAHEKQCDRYYECKNGTMTENLCPDGLMFNHLSSPNHLRCDYPFDVDCSDRPQVQQAQPTENCPHLWGLYPNVHDCGRFWNCVDGTSYSFQCPEGLAWNDLTARCDWPDQVESCDGEALLGFSCPVPSEDDIRQYGQLRYPHPGDCKKFFVCILTEKNEWKPRLLSCEEPTVFNYALNKCDFYKEVSGCENYYSYRDDDPRLNRAAPPRSAGSARQTGFSGNVGSSQQTGQFRNIGSSQSTGRSRSGGFSNTGSSRQNTGSFGDSFRSRPGR
ncbi:protein obstructor-E-like [Centruroides vittatus]|uniref:protein obstructor-E-like n=1 Tax=Centruroides vittatus TaxID=120091 RepID=UPI00350ED5DE